MADLFSLDNDLLGALDRATDGNLIVTTEFFNRVVGADHLDLMVGSVGSGPPYKIHVHALDGSDVVLADVVLPVNEEMDEPTKLAVLQVYTSCLVERAERQKRRLTLKGMAFESEGVQNRFNTANQEVDEGRQVTSDASFAAIAFVRWRSPHSPICVVSSHQR